MYPDLNLVLNECSQQAKLVEPLQRTSRRRAFFHGLHGPKLAVRIWKPHIKASLMPMVELSA